MFLHQFKYAFFTIIRSKNVLFWTGIFPIALATFMYMAFGNIYENDELFQKIPIAVVQEQENEVFMDVVEELSTGDDPLFAVIETSGREEAEDLLDKEEIAGIYLVEDEITLLIKENGIKQTILDEVLGQYMVHYQVIVDTMTHNPQALDSVMQALNNDVKYCKEVETSQGNQDNLATYFYAIFAMSCLFAGLTGVERTDRMQANTSALGMRRCLAPHSKMITILADFSASLISHFVIELIAFAYMSQILKIDFGDKIVAIFVLLFLGCTMGLSLGIIIGSLSNKTYNEKTSILSAVTMGMSVCADLVVNGIRAFFEHNVPIINRINPAALIVDSFYALNIYDNYNRFAINMITLGGITIVLLVISFMLLRRVRYASV